MKDPDKLVSLTDPSAVDRETHNRGDRFVTGLGNLAAWLFPILMLCITAQVFLRQAGNNQAWLDDLQWWLYGVSCLLGIAYAVTTNSHVQVDIFYENYDEKKRKRTDLFGLGWLFLPFALIAWDTTLHYGIASVVANEGSDSPNGLHNLWILKVLVNLCFVLLILAITARIWRILELAGEGTWWNRFKWTLPGTAFAMNLIVFYAAWWATRFTQPDMNTRSIAREGYLMAEIEYGPYETALTVVVSLALTAILGLVLFLRRTR
jgi:TRAP-type mannitol/chloroaromatic compound transport system permease small subunit